MKEIEPIQVELHSPIPETSLNEFELVIGNHQYEVHRKHIHSDFFPIKLFLWPALLQALIVWGALINSGMQRIPIVRSNEVITINNLVLIIGMVGSFLLVWYSILIIKREQIKPASDIKWRNFIPLMMALMVIEFVSITFFFYIFNQMFLGVQFDIAMSTLFSLVLFIIINYLSIKMIYSLTPMNVIKLLLGFMLGGVFIAMMTNSEKQWWQIHISFLGSNAASNAWRFNLTIILSALLMIVALDYLFVYLLARYPKHRGLRILGILLLITAVSLAAIGLFKSDGPGYEKQLHELFARILIFAVAVMNIGTHWFVPGDDKQFQRFSLLIGTLLFGFVVIYLSVSFITLTAFEIISFMIAGFWLYTLFQHLAQLASPEKVQLEVQINNHQHIL